FITCRDVVKDKDGNIVELRCTYDPETRGGNAPDGRKVKGTIHWVSAEHSLKAEVRLYDRLFTVENPLAEDDFMKTINPDSLTVLTSCRLEPSVAAFETGVPLQFERKGYFCVDPESMPDKLIFNRTISLRDTWKKIQRKTSGK
ncbi:MAG: glutamine--tRNA ligase, partial [Candidatus Aegiribacteria sp.]|nr:glutamine--tRNA ligase [Candidatus Aegiribacteria sp.]